MRISDWSSDVCSSDLPRPSGATAKPDVASGIAGEAAARGRGSPHVRAGGSAPPRRRPAPCRERGGKAPRRGKPPDYRSGRGRNHRSEEHTSELQSLMRISYAVFCLKKKKNNQ